jgi:uncharacterized protein (DUF697 family)
MTKAEDKKKTAATTEETPPVEAEVVEEEPTQHVSADKIVKDYMLWAAGLSLIPIPAVDMIAVAGLQVKMLSDLAERYDVPFNTQLGKTAIGTIIGTFAGIGLGSKLAFLVKGIPFIGPVIAFSSVSLTSGAATYALGKVFIKHFETGGTLLSLDVDKMKEFFSKQFQAGKDKMKTAAPEAN